MQTMPNTFVGPLSTVLACMLPELHAVKVSFYAELVGVVTVGQGNKDSGHTIRSAVAKIPCYRQTLRLYFLQIRSY